jgi:hypothetical protein
MSLQVIDALGVEGKVFALGTSQGSWIVVRMALIQPHRIVACKHVDIFSPNDLELANLSKTMTKSAVVSAVKQVAIC